MHTVGNVKTPSLLLIGGDDRRVTPAAAVSYYRALKSRNVDTKMHYYPDQGHAIPAVEQGTDAVMNMNLWFDKHLLVQEAQDAENAKKAKNQEEQAVSKL